MTTLNTTPKPAPGRIRGAGHVSAFIYEEKLLLRTFRISAHMADRTAAFVLDDAAALGAGAALLDGLLDRSSGDTLLILLELNKVFVRSNS